MVHANGVVSELLALLIRVAMFANLHEASAAIIVLSEVLEAYATVLNASSVTIEPDALLVHFARLVQPHHFSQAAHCVGSLNEAIFALAKARLNIATCVGDPAPRLAITNFIDLNSFLMEDEQKVRNGNHVAISSILNLPSECMELQLLTAC